MSRHKRKIGTPELRFNKEFQCWQLTLNALNESSEYEVYSMLINVGWTGDSWYTYKFIVEVAHDDWYECHTRDQLKDRIQQIAEHECQECADLWAKDQQQVMIVHDNHPVFDLQHYWEAMMELDLFNVPVTHFVKWGKNTHKELRDKMDAINKHEFMHEMNEDLDKKYNKVIEDSDLKSPYENDSGDVGSPSYRKAVYGEG